MTSQRTLKWAGLNLTTFIRLDLSEVVENLFFYSCSLFHSPRLGINMKTAF